MQILGVGHAIVDTYAFVSDDVPVAMGLHAGVFNRVPDYRMKAILLTLKSQQTMAGGSAANVVKLASRLGVSGVFASKIGNDQMAHLFESELLAAGVRPFLQRTDAATGTCVTFLSPNGGRTIATFRSASSDLPEDLISDAHWKEPDILVLEGYLLDQEPILETWLNRAKALKKKVFFDLSDVQLVQKNRNTLWKLWEKDLLTHIFANEEEIIAWAEVEPGAALQKLSERVEKFVLKRGELGCQFLENGQIVTVPAVGPTAFESTGAGDALEAGILWGMAEGLTWFDACRAGTVVASTITQFPGTKLDDLALKTLKIELTALTANP